MYKVDSKYNYQRFCLKTNKTSYGWNYFYLYKVLILIGSEQERKVAKFVNRYSTRRKQNIYKLETPKELDFTV